MSRTLKSAWTPIAVVVLVTTTAFLGYGVTSATADPTSRATTTTTPPAAPAPVLKPGYAGPRVREMQARLRQLGWYGGNVDGTYAAKTAAAVTRFQNHHHLPQLNYVDATFLTRLSAFTHTPSRGELANRYTDGSWTGARLDRRCRTGHTMCIDKTSRTLRWVVDGEVHRTLAVRFGASATPTREGLFHVSVKSRDHVSKLYGSSMPFAMFFSGGQAVHYSSDFAARGYAGASHGCVNVRDYHGLSRLFDQVKVGDKVVVYWS